MQNYLFDFSERTKHDLAMLCLQNGSISDITPENVVKKYVEVYNKICVDADNFLMSTTSSESEIDSAPAIFD